MYNVEISTSELVSILFTARQLFQSLAQASSSTNVTSKQRPHVLVKERKPLRILKRLVQPYLVSKTSL